MPICEEYADVFALKNDKMSVNNFYDYRLLYSQRERDRVKINTQFNSLVRNNLIEPSSSSSP